MRWGGIGKRNIMRPPPKTPRRVAPWPEKVFGPLPVSVYDRVGQDSSVPVLSLPMYPPHGLSSVANTRRRRRLSPVNPGIHTAVRSTHVATYSRYSPLVAKSNSLAKCAFTGHNKELTLHRHGCIKLLIY